MNLPQLIKLPKIFTATALTILLFLVFTLPVAAATTYHVAPDGSDDGSGSSSSPFTSIQKALDQAQPGDTIQLAPGTYNQNFRSVRNGLENAPIIISGPKDAIVHGSSNNRVIEINHDYLTLTGFTVDGLHGSASSEDGYYDKLIYLQGTQDQDGVNGVRLTHMTIKNAGGECIRLRYFAQGNEIANNTIENCGVYDFKFNDGGKNGEGVYIGTAPEQTDDGKNPTSDPDVSRDNWVHHNTINTQGNECIDIKEAATNNLIEYNTCTGQKDPNSAGLNSRGSGNIFRYNETYGNSGAGIRLGGDESQDGLNNHVYLNIIKNNQEGGIKVMREPQGYLCSNTFEGNDGGDTAGTYADEHNPGAACPQEFLDQLDQSGTTPTPTPTPTQDVPEPISSLNEFERKTIILIRELLSQVIVLLDDLVEAE